MINPEFYTIKNVFQNKEKKKKECGIRQTPEIDTKNQRSIETVKMKVNTKDIFPYF